jgi:flagellin
MIVNHNIAAMNSFRQLNKANNQMDNTVSRLSSGLRINKSADDSSGMAISQKMKAQIRGLEQAQRNIQDGISFIQAADSGLAQIIDPNLMRLKELAVQAASDTLTTGDRAAIQAEVNEILKGIEGVANGTSFNGIKPLVSETEIVENRSSSEKAKLDIVFLVDYSGSMGGDIGDVKSGVSDFVNELNTSLDAQVAIVNISTNPIVHSSFESDAVKIVDNLNSVGSTYTGGPWTRPYEAIEKSVPSGEIGQNLGYRFDSHKVFVIFTDVSDEAAGSYFGSYPFSESRSTNAVEGPAVSSGYDQDDIQTFLFSFREHGQTSSSFDNIVNSTGGKIYSSNIGTPDEINSKLKNDLISDITDNIYEKTITADYVILQTGPNADDKFEIPLTDARTKALGIDELKVDPFDEAIKAITSVDQALEKTASERSKFGAYQNGLEHIYNNLMNYEDNLAETVSRITDADIAKESMEYAKQNLLSQSAQAIFAQANQKSQSILELLK